VRVTGRHFAVDGFWKNNSDPSSNVGFIKKDSVMAVGLFTPNDRLKAKFLFSWSRDDDGLQPTVKLTAFNYNGGPATQYQSRQLSCNVGGIGFGPWWCGQLPKADELGPLNQAGKADIISWSMQMLPQIQSILIDNSLKLQPNLFDPHWVDHFGTKQQSQATHAVFDYTTPGGWVFNSTTALHYTKYQGVLQTAYRDATGVPNTAPNRVLPYIAFYLLFQGRNWDSSQELRVTSPQDQRLRGTLGGNYLSAISPGGVNYGIQPSGPGVSGTTTRAVASTPAVFGGVYYDITPELTLGAEARYQWDTISATAKFPIPAPAQAGTLRATYTSFSPRVTLDYNFQPGGTIYALWSRGYRPGGFNNSLVGQPASVLSSLGNLNVGVAFQQERLDNYEVGIKGTWLDNRIQTAVGGYFDQWRNGQVSNSIAVQTPTNIQMVTATQNVGSVDMYGIEFTGAFAATEHLTITGNANYVHSKILSYVYLPNGLRINGTTNVNGHAFQNVPIGWTFTVTPQYTDHLAGDWDWYARLDWKHRGRYFPNATNIDWIGARNIIDVHLGVKNQNLNLEVFALNLNKDYTFQSGEYGADSTCCALTAPNINEVRLLLPAKRQFGIRGSYTF
jgi:iron complex outermembrane recepter protein